MQHINIGEIIAQEIANCSVKNERMMYFPCLITGLCKKNLVPELEGDEIQKPINGFDAKAIDTLLKGNTRRKSRLQLPASAPSTAATGMPEAIEKMDKMHKEMQVYWQWSNKFSLWLEAQFLYCFPWKTFASLPLFPAELLRIEPEEKNVEETMSNKLEPSKKAEKKRSKSGKKKKSGKKDKKPKEDKAALVTSEEQPKAVESNQQLPGDDHLSTPDAHVLAQDSREGMSNEKKVVLEDDQVSQEVINQDKEVVSEEVRRRKEG
jgi:hypothetical protein